MLLSEDKPELSHKLPSSAYALFHTMELNFPFFLSRRLFAQFCIMSVYGCDGFGHLTVFQLGLCVRCPS